MNIATYFKHWSIAENPFRAEEARNDAVFSRLGAGPMCHPDFEKIIGDLSSPSTSIVFGEKGSGKTAIRLQIAQRVREHNAAHPETKTLLVAYDDLNETLERFIASADLWSRRRSKSDAMDGALTGEHLLKRFRTLRLVDHMDAILSLATTQIVDGLLADPRRGDDCSIAVADAKQLRRTDPSILRDMMILQVCYDRPESAPNRTAKLRARLRASRGQRANLWAWLAFTGWLLPVGAILAWFFLREDFPSLPWIEIFLGALGLWALLLAKYLAWDRWRLARVGRKLSRQLRTLNRAPRSFGRSLQWLTKADCDAATLPLDEADDQRYAMFARLLRVLRAIGHRGALIVLDRIDEPTLVSGDPQRMQAIIWPVLNNKLLQMDDVGFKLLLPMDLRYALYRESNSFFQEARLDKQNLVEKLLWTGSTLYDLCNARLAVCREPGSPDISLVDLFEEDVNRQDVVDALDQMHQPRDAFKFLYRCIQEHCSNVTEEQVAWRVPRLILETVRKEQAERVQQLYRGVRPA